MEFTALELLLGGGFVTAVTAIGMHCFDAQKYVTRREFEKFLEDMQMRDGKLSEKFDVLFKMNRSIIQFLPLSAREKAKILNTTPQGGSL